MPGRLKRGSRADSRDASLFFRLALASFQQKCTILIRVCIRMGQTLYQLGTLQKQDSSLSESNTYGVRSKETELEQVEQEPYR